MEFFEYSLILFTLLIIGGVSIMILKRPSKLNQAVAQKHIHDILNTKNLSPEHSIIESHKLFVSALKTLNGSKQNAAKVIAQHQKRFNNTKQIWGAHRLRNQIAHEVGINITSKEAETVRKNFIQALKKLTKK